MGRPSHSAYAALPTSHARSSSVGSTVAGEREHDSLSDGGDSTTSSRPASSGAQAGVDSVKRTAAHYDDLLSKWTHAISDKMHKQKHDRQLKRQRRRALNKRDRDQPLPIIDSVFQPWHKPDEPKLDKGKGKGKENAEGEGEVDEDVEWLTLDHGAPMSRRQFDLLAGQVELAIENGVQPRLNAKGSSGSYFAKDQTGKTIAIFKPKDEEVSIADTSHGSSHPIQELTFSRLPQPYGSLNPKFTKWVHRVFLSRIIVSGNRACEGFPVALSLTRRLSRRSRSAARVSSRNCRTCQKRQRL